MLKQLPALTPGLTIIPKFIQELYNQAVIPQTDFKFVKCQPHTLEKYVKPLGKHSSMFMSVDTALNKLLNNDDPGYTKTTIVRLCNAADFLQKRKSKSVPLIMFYFPMIVEKIQSNVNLHTQNTLVSLNKLKKYYNKRDIKSFINCYDKFGSYFCERYMDSVSFFRDSRHSFIYQPFVPAIVQFAIEQDPNMVQLKFWIQSDLTVTFGGASDHESQECMRAIMWLRKLFPKTKKYRYNIRIMLTGMKKSLPSKTGNFIGPSNVNSGYSVITSGRQREIFVYRHEEFLKVLIHEYLHTNICNFNVNNDQKIMKFLESFVTQETPIFAEMNPKDIKDKSELIFNSSHLRNPNEALTELGANILTIIYRSPIDKFVKNFNEERKFALFQCAKILNYYGLTDVQQLTKSSSNGPIIKQTTNVVPYYIFRAMLYHNPKKLFQYYRLGKNLCYLGETESTLILREMLTKFTPEFRKDINNLISWIRTKTTSDSPEFFKTLRMTIGVR